MRSSGVGASESTKSGWNQSSQLCSFHVSVAGAFETYPHN